MKMRKYKSSSVTTTDALVLLASALKADFPWMEVEMDAFGYWVVKACPDIEIKIEDVGKISVEIPEIILKRRKDYKRLP